MSAPGATSRDTAAAEPQASLRLGRSEPLVWIAPALAVVVFVFGYSMVELVRQALAHHGTLGRPRELPAHVQRPDVPARRSSTTPACCSPCPCSSCSPCSCSVLLFEALRGWRFHRATVFLPYVLPIPVVARHLRPAAAAERPRSTGRCAVLVSAPGVRLARAAGLGPVDDDGRDHLEGARLRRDPLPRPPALRCRPRRSRRRGSTARASSGCTAS